MIAVRFSFMCEYKRSSHMQIPAYCVPKSKWGMKSNCNYDDRSFSISNIRWKCRSICLRPFVFTKAVICGGFNGKCRPLNFFLRDQSQVCMQIVTLFNNSYSIWREHVILMRKYALLRWQNLFSIIYIVVYSSSCKWLFIFMPDCLPICCFTTINKILLVGNFCDKTL